MRYAARPVATWHGAAEVNLGDIAFWLVAAAVLVVVELLTGTFYLLMVAFGCATGALVALSGLPFTLQVLIAAGVGAVAVLLLRRTRWGRGGRRPEPEANPDLVIDLGQLVDVAAWHNGRARVSYRGAQWDAVPEAPESAATGKLAIKAIRGSTLVLGPAPTSN